MLRFILEYQQCIKSVVFLGCCPNPQSPFSLFFVVYVIEVSMASESLSEGRCADGTVRGTQVDRSMGL